MKQIREILGGAKKKSEKKKTQSAEAKAKRMSQKNLLTGAIFLVVGGLMSIFTAILLFQRVFIASDLEKLLPEKNLVGFLNIEQFEIPSAQESVQESWQQKFKQVQSFFLDFHPDEVVRWRGNRGGVAFYGDDQGTVSRITFISIGDKTALSEYLASQKRIEREEFLGHTILTLSGPRSQYCSVISGYFACSQSRDNIHMILESKNSQSITIFESQDFQRTVAELPRNHILRIFVRSDPFFSTQVEGNTYRIFFPLLKVASEFGAALTENGRDKSIDSHFLLFRKEIAPEKDLSNEIIEFTGLQPSLLSYVPKDTKALLWGNDFTEDFSQGISYFENIDASFRQRLEEVLSQKITEFFGNNISWAFDILPLLEGEFIFGDTGDNGEIFIIVRTNDEEFASAKLEKFKNSLQKMATRFLPRIVENTLGDGTSLREIFPEEVDITVTEKQQNEATVIFFSSQAEESTNFDLGLAQKGNILFFTTSPQVLQEMLSKKSHPDILQNFPLRFAGSSEEVFVFTYEFLTSQFPDLGSLLPEFEKISGKIVNTPIFFRIQFALQL